MITKSFTRGLNVFVIKETPETPVAPQTLGVPGTPVLVVQAGAMSRPILERLGFEKVAWVKVLVDRFE